VIFSIRRQRTRKEINKNEKTPTNKQTNQKKKKKKLTKEKSQRKKKRKKMDSNDKKFALSL